jgi:hypothetical protein
MTKRKKAQKKKAQKNGKSPAAPVIQEYPKALYKAKPPAVARDHLTRVVADASEEQLAKGQGWAESPMAAHEKPQE